MKPTNDGQALTQRPEILVLDDQVQYGRSLERALRAWFRVQVATSQDEARRCMSPETKIVLTDIRLEESNPQDRQGLEFIVWARTRRPDLVIIAMSALDDENVERDARESGATTFLRKPIVVSRLKELLQVMTGSGGATNK